MLRAPTPVVRGTRRPLRSDRTSAAHRGFVRDRRPRFAYGDRIPGRGIDAADRCEKHRPPLRPAPRTQQPRVLCRARPDASDPAASFPAPTVSPTVSARPANPLAGYIAHGNRPELAVREQLRAQSTPNMRKQWKRLEAQQHRLGTALAPRRRTATDFVRDPRLPGSPYLFNGLFFCYLGSFGPDMT